MNLNLLKLIEIIFIIFLSRLIGKKAIEKGRYKGSYIILLVCLWILGEIIGAFIGKGLIKGKVINYDGLFNMKGLIIYLFALTGAAFGALIAFLIVNKLKVMTNCKMKRGEIILKKLLVRLKVSLIGVATILFGFFFKLMAIDYYGEGIDSVGMPVVGWMIIASGIVIVVVALAGGFEKVVDSKLKPSETNTSITLENKQNFQPDNPPEGKSIINITRPFKIMGLVQIFDVCVDERTKIVLHNGQTHKIFVLPGYHRICIQVQGLSLCSDPFSFSLASGETIDISCNTRFNRSPLIKKVSDKKKIEEV